MRKTPFPRRRLSLEEYLAMEEASPIKHEFVAGEVYAMWGVTLVTTSSRSTWSGDCMG